jgi:DNA polymerase III delta subunit
MAPRAVSDPRVLLLHGEESFLVEEEAKRMLDAWRAELVSDFGFEALDPGALNAGKLRDAVRQLPFLDPFRIVAVRSLPVRRAEGLAAGLKEIPDTTRVLLTVSGRLGAANALAKAVAAAEQGLSREFARLKGRSLGDWASDRARALGLPPSIASMVLRASPADLGIIDSELRKLSTYHASGFPLDRDTLAALLAGGHEEEVFRLTDNLLPRPSGDAFRVARSLVRSGESPTTLAYRVSRQLAMVLAVRARRDRGESLAEIQAAMSEHPFRVQKAFEAAGSVDSARLEDGLKALLAYEWEVKSGQVDAELGLDGVLARL